MSDDVVLSANKREVIGKKVKALRRSGSIPAVVHDHGKDSMHVSVVELELKKAYKAAGKHQPVKIKLDGKTHTAIIKEVTRMPGRTTIAHTVFQAVDANETVKTEIPIHLIGEAPAEKLSLLVLKNLENVEVEALPKDLVDAIEVDMAPLAEVGDKLTAAELQVPDGITILTEPEQVIATVEMPKDQIAEADAALEEQKAQDGTTDEESTEESSEESTDAAKEESTEETKS